MSPLPGSVGSAYRATGLVLLGPILLFIAACSADSPSETLVDEPTPVVAPLLNVSISSVELSDIVFDQFDGGFVPFPEASEQLISELTDAIPPIYDPEYGDSEDGEWLNDRELVIGYSAGSDSFAYPIRMLNFHELIADEIDGIPILVTY